MDRIIQFIDQRLLHLRLLIHKCKAQLAAVEKRLADLIITLKIKRNNAIQDFEKRRGKLRALISVFKSRFPT